MTWRLERHAFVVCVLLAAFPLRVTSLDVPHATSYANTYCGARYINIAGWRGCPRDTIGTNPNWYNENYYCWDPNGAGEDSADAKTNCDETMRHFELNCYTEGTGYSDCANFVSQIIQAGCGGLCQNQRDLFAYCDTNAAVYFSVFNCERWNCQGVGRYVAQRMSMWMNMLQWSGWWTWVADIGPFDLYAQTVQLGDLIVWDWTNDLTFDHIVYVVVTSPGPPTGDEYWRAHSSDRCPCNQITVRQTFESLPNGTDSTTCGEEITNSCPRYRVYRWYGNPSSDPLYALRRNGR